MSSGNPRNYVCAITHSHTHTHALQGCTFGFRRKSHIWKWFLKFRLNEFIRKKTDTYKKVNIYKILLSVRTSSWETWAKRLVFAEYHIVRLPLFSLLFEGEISFHQALTAAVAHKDKGCEKKRVQSFFFLLWFTFLIPCRTLTLLTHPSEMLRGRALLFSQLIILLTFKVNWKRTSQFHSKNIKHLFCNVITNDLLSILHVTPTNWSL